MIRSSCALRRPSLPLPLQNYHKLHIIIIWVKFRPNPPSHPHPHTHPLSMVRSVYSIMTVWEWKRTVWGINCLCHVVMSGFFCGHLKHLFNYSWVCMKTGELSEIFKNRKNGYCWDAINSMPWTQSYPKLQTYFCASISSKWITKRRSMKSSGSNLARTRVLGIRMTSCSSGTVENIEMSLPWTVSMLNKVPLSPKYAWTRLMFVEHEVIPHIDVKLPRRS